MRGLTLGSIFDGIGAIPYAASFYGIKTLWASEILPEAVSVTRRHFPRMKHVGDVTKLDGATLTPVSIIAFGSPCQDLSHAAGGNRKGLAGARSGLFREAIRIINEMRCATNGKYPRYAIWENVPGCFSSGDPKGSDFKAVLEAFAGREVPMPLSGKWANAGVVGIGRACVAWCVYNAADFGLAQRRKRVFLVADFGGGSSPEILFKPKSLSGYFAACGIAGQGTSPAAESGAVGAGIAAYGICSYNSNSMKSGNPKSGVYEAKTARTLDLNCGNPACNQGGIAVMAFNGGASPQAGGIAYSETVLPTLKSASSVLRTPCVCTPEIARTLTARGDSSPCADRGQNIVALGTPTAYGFDLQQITSKTNRSSLKEVQPSLCASCRPHVVRPDISGTLCASGAGLSHPAGMRSETDLAVAYCIQGNLIGRKDGNGPAGKGINEDICYTLNGTDRHAVAVDCRNFKEGGQQCGALQAKASGYSLNYQNAVREGFSVRRLTPVECERLMGLPDDYTKYREDGGEISDSKRYSMLGNSIATPCAAHILQGILEEYEEYGME